MHIHGCADGAGSLLPALRGNPLFYYFFQIGLRNDPGSFSNRSELLLHWVLHLSLGWSRLPLSPCVFVDRIKARCIWLPDMVNQLG
jgi:hypothetical protein